MNYDVLSTNQKKAVADELQCTLKDLQDYLQAGDYLLLTDAEADERAAEEIKNLVWAFNADFILSECGLDSSGVESLRAMQEKTSEGAQGFILSLIERTCGIDSFVQAAISADGRGHFLSPYDGEEIEVSSFNNTLYLYRVN